MKWKRKVIKAKNRTDMGFYSSLMSLTYRYRKGRLAKTKIRFHHFHNIIIAERIVHLSREEKCPSLQFCEAFSRRNFESPRMIALIVCLTSSTGDIIGDIVPNLARLKKHWPKLKFFLLIFQKLEEINS